MEHPEEREPLNVITSDTDNATIVHPKEAPPSKRGKFKRLRAYNRGTWNGPRREDKGVVHRQDNLQRFDAITSTLELTQSQKAMGRDIFDSIDLGEFNKLSETIDDVVFGLAVVVANSDVDGGTRYWPHPDNGASDALFEEFAESINLSVDEQMSIVQRVSNKTNL